LIHFYKSYTEVFGEPRKTAVILNDKKSGLVLKWSY